MRAGAIVAVMAMGLAVSGCTTNTGNDSYLRFAPPSIPIKDPDYQLASANALIDSFINAYRNAQNANADARQNFEVPGFLVTIGAVAAAAFGGGRDVALAGATAGALFKGGNAYYAPKAKAAMYGDALDAMTCIQNVATGGKPYEQPKAKALADSFGPTIDTTIYYLVRNGALGVDQILRTRLSNAGSVIDLGSIADEYQKAVKDEVAAKDAAGTAASNFVAATTDAEMERAASAQRNANVDELQAQIQQCILRAKA
ncbi:hypothetical protein BH10PSE14_BH10PSE14_02640 [soil metagenome]